MRTALTIAIAALAACSNGGAFEARYHWREGSMPPPHHYEYDISVGPGEKGAIAYRPDYGAQPEWKEEFAVPAAEVEKLRKLMSDVGVFSKTWSEKKDPPVGGAYSWLDATSDGKSVKVAPFPEEPGRIAEVYSAIRELVPKPVWDSLAARRAEYAKEREK